MKIHFRLLHLMLIYSLIMMHLSIMANDEDEKTSQVVTACQSDIKLTVRSFHDPRLEIVPVGAELKEKVKKIRKALKYRERGGEGKLLDQPQTIEDAVDFLYSRSGLAFNKTNMFANCFEYKDVYYFEYATSKRGSFNSGFAVRKGKDNIYRWKSLDEQPSPIWDIIGAKVSTYEQAEQLTTDHYKQKMNLTAMDKELVINPQKITLLYDVPGFAKNGETIWEAKVITNERSLRALIWINPRTGQVRCLTGPWETPPDRRTPETLWRTIGEAGGHKLSRTKVLSVKGKLLDSIDPINKAMRAVRHATPTNPEKSSPATIEDAAALLSRCVRIVGPPANCFEYANTYYFSDQSGMDEDFRSGYAIKRGEPAIYRWENGSIPIIPGPIIKTPVSRSEATRIARENYREKMKLTDKNIQHDLRPSLITLDYDIPDFAVKNEQIWEARFWTFKGELLAIIWINRLKQMRFLMGPWENASK